MSTQREFWSDTGRESTGGGRCINSSPMPPMLIGTPTASMKVRSQEFSEGRAPNPAELVNALELISSVADSPANLFLWREGGEEWLMTVGSGQRFAKLSQSSNQDGCWLKMYGDYSQSMMGGCSEEYSETWPSSGSMRNGQCYRQAPLMRRIKEIEFMLFPMPQEFDSKDSAQWSDDWHHRNSTRKKGKRSSLTDRLLPTPQHRDWKSGKASDEVHSQNCRPL